MQRLDQSVNILCVGFFLVERVTANHCKVLLIDHLDPTIKLLLLMGVVSSRMTTPRIQGLLNGLKSMKMIEIARFVLKSPTVNLAEHQ